MKNFVETNAKVSRNDSKLFNCALSGKCFYQTQYQTNPNREIWKISIISVIDDKVLHSYFFDDFQFNELRNKSMSHFAYACKTEGEKRNLPLNFNTCRKV